MRMIVGRKMLLLLLTLVLGLAACSDNNDQAVSPTAPPAEPTATPLPEINIVEREQLVIGLDSAFPPFADLDADGEPIGFDVDIFETLAISAELDYQFVSADWDTIFVDLAAGRFDVALGGLTPEDVADAGATELVELSEPYFEIGQVAVALSSNQDIVQLSDLAHAVVGVQPLSWAEFAVSGQEAFFPLPATNLRRYDSPEVLIDALFADHVDAIITHHTVIDSYSEINPGYLSVLSAGRGAVAKGQEIWLTSRSYHIVVPKGADELLATLNEAIELLAQEGQLAAVAHDWGYSPIFAERPKFVQDSSAESLIAGIEKVDGMTVRFILNRPDPYFEYRLTAPAMAIHSPASLALRLDSGDLITSPMGTGPFLVKDWQVGRPLTLTANPDYWGTPPLLETVIITPVQDAAQRYAMLKANQVQLIDNLSQADMDELEDNPNKDIVFQYRTPVNVAYLGMNRDLEPFNNRSVRLAVANCIDQPALVETDYLSGTLISGQFVPPNTFGFTPGLLWYDRDTERATTYLSNGGHPDGLRVTLTLADQPSDYLPAPQLIAETIQAQLAQCQITSTIRLLDAATFAEQTAAGELSFFISGWSADFPGPINFLNTHFDESGMRPFGAPYPEIVDLLEQAAVSTDRTQRQSLYDQVNGLLKEKAVFVPLAHGGSSLAARAELTGVTVNPVRRESLAPIGPAGEEESSSAAVAASKPITTLVYAVSAPPLSLDPSDELDDATFLVTNQIFETLVAYEPSTTILAPGLALEWSSNEAGDVWEFTLRPNVHFHDGRPLDADAVILNFERMWDANHPLHDGQFRYFQILFGGFRPAE